MSDDRVIRGGFEMNIIILEEEARSQKGFEDGVLSALFTPTLMPLLPLPKVINHIGT